jgi:hypothetical protein
MRDHMVSLGLAVAVVMVLAGSAVGQESSATIRTYQGVSYKVADPSLEVFYTIGEPKGMEGGATQGSAGQPFTTMINVAPSAGAAPGGDQSASTGPGEEKKLLRGHSRANDIALSRQGVTTRVAWDQIRALRFERKPMTVEGLRLPPYVPYYSYAASVTLMNGEKVEAGIVNLGGAIVRGTRPTGLVDIPWQEVEYITFDR